MILRFGYSKAGLQNLRPSSGDWVLASLVLHKATLTPDVLDPTLKSLQDLFAKGMMEAEGYEPSAELLAKRESNVGKQNPNPVPILRKNLLKRRVKNLRATKDRPVCRQKGPMPALPMKG